MTTIRRIYEDYAIYKQSGGAEQVIFPTGPDNPIARSEVAVAKLQGLKSLPATGRLLDVGCGNGALLRAFARAVPGWSLVGTELSDTNRAAVESIEGVERLHVGPVSTIEGTFDVVTLMHVLEHIVSPDELLGDIRQKMNPSGILVIDIPNHLSNPFDLVVADHSSHFDSITLERLLNRGGFHVEKLLMDAIPKEMIVIARPATADEMAPSIATQDGADPAEALVAWLHAMKDRFCVQAEEHPVGIFGSSIAATWAFGAVGGVDFFVDEDPHRERRRHLGVPIIIPAEAPRGSKVLMSIAPVLATAIGLRGERPGVTYCVPPPLPV